MPQNMRIMRCPLVPTSTMPKGMSGFRLKDGKVTIWKKELSRNEQVTEYGSTKL